MGSGQILVDEHEGVYVIKLIGDVRLTLCVSFDRFIEDMFANEPLKSVLFDLTEAEAIDSTTLGLMAKISIGARDRGLAAPTVLVSSAGIERLLVSMGFEDIFEVLRNKSTPLAATEPLSEIVDDERAVEQKVLEAHQILMNINNENMQKFHDLVESLQDQDNE